MGKLKKIDGSITDDKLKRKFFRKPKGHLEPDKQNYYKVFCFGNLYIDQALEKIKDRVTEPINRFDVSLLIFGYEYVFFTKKHLKYRMAVGTAMLNTAIPKLKRQGLLELFSPKQTIEYEEQRVGYKFIQEKKLAERLRLSKFSTKVVEDLFESMNKTLYNEDVRDLEDDFINRVGD